jgi:hypothetical protein
VLVVLVVGGGWLLRRRSERRDPPGPGPDGRLGSDGRLDALRGEILGAASRLREAIVTRHAWHGHDVCTLVARELWHRHGWTTIPADALASSVQESLIGPVQPLAAALSQRVHGHRRDLLLTDTGPRIIEATGNVVQAVDFVAPNLAWSIRAWVGVAQRVGAYMDWTPRTGQSWEEPERVRTRGIAPRTRSRPTPEDLARRMMTARHQVAESPVDDNTFGWIHGGLDSLISDTETMVGLPAGAREPRLRGGPGDSYRRYG